MEKHKIVTKIGEKYNLSGWDVNRLLVKGQYMKECGYSFDKTCNYLLTEKGHRYARTIIFNKDGKACIYYKWRESDIKHLLTNPKHKSRKKRQKTNSI